jgi:hypothetical protein
MLDSIQHPAIIYLITVSFVCIGNKLLQTRSTWSGRFMQVAALVLIGVYLVMMLVYLLKPGYWDPVEPSVTAVAQQLRQGRQIYHALDSAPRFSLLYGPSVFISNAAALSLFDNPILASKLSGVFWGIAAMLSVLWALRRSFGSRLAFIGLGWAVALALWYENYTYWNRADSLLLFCTSAGLVALLIRRKWLSWLVMSLVIGIAVNTKIHAPLYYVPLIALLYVRQGWRACVPPLLLAAVWLIMPFAFFPQSFSLLGYVTWFTDVGSLPMSSVLLWRNLEYGFLLAFLPGLLVVVVAIGVRNMSQMFRLIFPALTCIACVLVGAIIGAIPAAGPHHLIPFIPSIVYLTIDLYANARAQIRQTPAWPALRITALSILIPAWIIASAATIIIGQIQTGFYDFVIPDEGPVQSDLLALKTKYGESTLQMGYGDDEGHRATYFRPWLYTGSTEYFLDSMAMMDMQAIGVKIPPATIDALTTQRFDIWLIPRTELPFSMRSLWFADHPPLFSLELRQAFLDNYIKIDRSQFYDVWAAKHLGLRGVK